MCHPFRGTSRRGGEIVKRLLLALAVLGALASAGSASAAWSTVGSSAVASSPVLGGGYPIPPGSTKPIPGTCGEQLLNSNHSESWLAVKPGTEDLVGDSKFFMNKWSTFYDFQLGSYTILDGSPVANNQVQGYECTTVDGPDPQAMPPSWEDNTDPNVDFDTGALGTQPVRAYMTTLPFNAFWEGGMHPNGEIDVSYSDNMGRNWVRGNGGRALDNNRVCHGHATKSVDDGRTWGPFVLAASPVENPLGYLPPTNFRDGIIENFTASPTYPGHLYLTYENYDPVGGHMDVYFAQSTDGGLTWSAPSLVNDDANTAATDQFQPSVAAGPGGAVAIAFYDRRAACPSDASIIAAHRGDANTCLHLSPQ